MFLHILLNIIHCEFDNSTISTNTIGVFNAEKK